MLKNLLKNPFAAQNTASKNKKNWIILITLCVLVAIGLILFVRQYQKLGDTIENERFTYVSEIKNQLVNNIEMKKDMQTAALSVYRSGIESLNITSFSALPRLNANPSSETDTFFFLDEQGVFYTQDGKTVSLSGTDLAQRLILEQETVFDYAQVNNAQEYWIYGEPVQGIMLDGIPIRAIINAQDLELFSSQMDSNLLESNCQTYIISQDGTILIYPEKENDMGYNLFQSLVGLGASAQSIQEIQEQIRQGNSSQSFLNYQDNKWILSYSGNIFDNWVVVVLMPVTITASDTYHMMRLTLYALSLLVASILGTLFFGVLLFYQRERTVQKEKMDLVVMQRSAQVKNEFLSKMSHDIRTPLNAIIGLLKIVERDSKDQPQIQTNLEKIEQSAKYLLAVLNDILDMSKIESGKMTLHNAPFNLPELFQNLETMNRAQAEQKGIQFQTCLDGIYAQTYLGDQLRLNQILMNLLSNAIKFTNQNGVVRFSLHVSPGKQGQDHLRFVIEDTGIGMSEEHVANLYQPFEQEDASTCLNYAGSGLGLSIVKSLVELMNGTIHVTSTKGTGSRFEVSLYLTQANSVPEHSSHVQSAPKCSLSGRKLLLAEDNELNRMIAKELISTHCEMTVDEAENGAQAIERFAASAPDEYAAILMDVRMPIIDGLEATRAIRALSHPRAKTVPIIAMSANAFQEDMERSVQAGMNVHLSKPLDIELVKTQLQIYIQKENMP
ncbi:MAG: ATP-binding protein [Peptococcaceae bacterium]